MFTPELFFIGIGIGLLGVLPVGPVNIMCINRSLHTGLAAGLATGIGGLLADVLFASAAIFSVQAILAFITTYKMLLQTIGGTILIFIGLHIARSRTQFHEDRSNASVSTFSMGLSAFLVTLTNPAPLFYFASAFSGLGVALSGANSLPNAITLLLGVAAGAGGWWCAISILVSRFRDRFSLQWMSRINLVSGGFLILFGAVIIADYALGLELLKKLAI